MAGPARRTGRTRRPDLCRPIFALDKMCALAAGVAELAAGTAANGGVKGAREGGCRGCRVSCALSPSCRGGAARGCWCGRSGWRAAQNVRAEGAYGSGGGGARAHDRASALGVRVGAPPGPAHPSGVPLAASASSAERCGGVLVRCLARHGGGVAWLAARPTYLAGAQQLPVFMSPPPLLSSQKGKGASTSPRRGARRSRPSPPWWVRGIVAHVVQC